jgi:hypothetical protein
VSVTASTPCVSLGNLSVVSPPAGDPDSLFISGSSWVVPQEEEIKEIGKRLALVEENIKLLPGVVGEVILSAFAGLVYSGDSRLQQAMVVTGGGCDTGFHISTIELLSGLRDKVREAVQGRIDFSEIEKLRDRVRQLEDDLGYRKKVAEKLREDYHK